MPSATVLAEIGADKVPEIIVINKADAADPMVIARLRQREPHSVVVSAKTGEGIDAALKRRGGRAAPARRRVRGPGAVRARRPARPAPPQGEIDSLEHTGEGTVVRGRATEALAGELASYAV